MLLFVRMDAGFREHANDAEECHSTGISPFLLIPGLDMIYDFSIDYFHCSILGIMKKLVKWWTEGPLKHRIPLRKRESISERLIASRPFVPSAFTRRPRSFTERKDWKGSEWSLFLFYFGPVTLKENLSSKVYRHFLLFWCGRSTPGKVE